MTLIYKIEPDDDPNVPIMATYVDGKDLIMISQGFDCALMTPTEVIELAGATIDHVVANHDTGHYTAIACLARQLSQIGRWTADHAYVPIGLPIEDPPVPAEVVRADVDRE